MVTPKEATMMEPTKPQIVAARDHPWQSDWLSVVRGGDSKNDLEHTVSIIVDQERDATTMEAMSLTLS
jgi:hypothetical protein